MKILSLFPHVPSAGPKDGSFIGPVKQAVRLCLITLACLSGLLPSAQAQTSFPMIISTFPTGVQRGKTTLVTVNTGVVNGGGGNNLYGAYKAFFEGEGVTAEIVPPDKGWPAKDPKTPNVVPVVSSVTMKVIVAPNAPLGTREYRFATPKHGISTVGLLVIGDEPEVMEAEPNNDPEHAQPVTLPCVINGRFQQGEDVDFYKIKVDAGQEVTLTALCARLEDKVHDLDPHADPMLVLRDMTGNEIARNDDYYRADPLLHYKFEKAGEYMVQIRDVNYKGSPNWVYRLNITARPFVTGVVPCAVRPGQSNEMRVLGYNLGGTATTRLDVPANTPPGLWSTSLSLPNGTTNVVQLLVTDAPQAGMDGKATATAGNKTVTAGAGSSPAIAMKGSLALPGGVNSWPAAEGQIDRYAFQAKKGQPWGFEVTARRIDSELDSEIKIRDEKGNVLAENDDALGKDSKLDWTAPADGNYTIEVRDLTGHGGTNCFYNLTAQPLKPDFRLKCDTDRAMIAPGNRTCWFVILERRYGFTGEVKIEATGLPEGVTASSLTIPPEMTQGVLLLSAAPTAKIDFSRVQLTGTAMLPGADGKPAPTTRKVTPLTEIYMPGGGRGTYEVITQGVAVTEPNDLEVIVANPQITLTPGQTAKIEVEIKRLPGYTKAVTLDLRVNHLGGIHTNPLPPGVTVDDAATIPENQSKGAIIIKVAADAKPITNWPVAVMANVSINFVMKVWYCAPITITVAPPPKK